MEKTYDNIGEKITIQYLKTLDSSELYHLLSTNLSFSVIYHIYRLLDYDFKNILNNSLMEDENVDIISEE